MTLEQLMQNPGFASLPPDWQQEIAGQVQQYGLDQALQMNKNWLQGKATNDPAVLALTQWTNNPNATGATTPGFQVQPLEQPQTPQAPQAPQVPGQPQVPVQPTNPSLGAGISQLLNQQGVPIGNLDQGQVGTQTGAYGSSGASNQQQTNETSGTQQQDTVGTQQQNTIGTNQQNVSGTQQQDTSGTQQQHVAGTNQQNVTGSNQQSNIGQTNQATTGTQTSGTTGQSTTQNQVDDTLGFGALLAGQAGGLAQTDAERSSWLSDLMNNGGTAFNSQVDQAVRQSLSGPSMIRAGDNAQDRAAGYAAAEVARTNLGQRLQASQQLAGPTSLATNSGAAVPYLGGSSATQQDSNTTGVTQSNTVGTSSNEAIGTTNQQATGSNTNDVTGTSSGRTIGTTNQDSIGGSTNNMTGGTTGSTAGSNTGLNIGSLLTNESQQGTATGTSAQGARGTVPENSQQSGGGCYVCTAYASLGLMPRSAILRGAQYKLNNLKKYGTALLGYSLYGPLLARAVLAYPLFAKILFPAARATLYEECRRANPVRLPRRLSATFYHAAFHHGSQWIGACARLVGVSKIETRQADVRQLLHNTKLWFNIN